VCAPSRNVLMTGQDTGHTQIRGNAKINLRPEDITVAQVVHEAGYATGMFGKWGLGSEGSLGTPTKKGFDAFFGYVDQSHAHNYYPTFLVRNDTRVPLRNVVPNEGQYGTGEASVKLDYSDDLIMDHALQFLDQHKNGPFCMYLTSTLPHANDEAKTNGSEIPSYGIYANENWPDPEKGYAAMITRLDDDVGRLLKKLDELGVANNTLVIFSSDNGAQQEGGHLASFFNSSGPLRGIKRDVYEGGIRDPFIAYWPGHTPVGAVSTHPAYFGDWMETVAEITGGKAPPNLDSQSFLPTLLGHPENQPPDKFIYWEFYENGSSQALLLTSTWSADSGSTTSAIGPAAVNWKIVRIPMLTGPIQLYDLNTDIGETHDVAAQHPDIVARARAIMDKEHVPSPLWLVPSPMK
jgi:arylsulfatase A-like enzyme